MLPPTYSCIQPIEADARHLRWFDAVSLPWVTVSTQSLFAHNYADTSAFHSSQRLCCVTAVNQRRLNVSRVSPGVSDSVVWITGLLTNLLDMAPLCWCSILSNSSEARTIPLSVWLSWEETQRDALWVQSLPLTQPLCLRAATILGNYLRRKLPKSTGIHKMSPAGQIKSLRVGLFVGASPGATLQTSSLWAGTLWTVPQTHSRQRARSYNT